MVNVSNNALILAPVTSTMIDSKKGSIGNRTECAVRQKAQQVKDTVEFGAAAGATGVGYHLINKNMAYKIYGWNTKLNKYLKNFIKVHMPKVNLSANELEGCTEFQKFGRKTLAKIGNKIRDFAVKLSKTSGRQKVLGAFVAVTATGLLYLAKKQSFRRGQIDQKYNDRAAAQQLSR